MRDHCKHSECFAIRGFWVIIHVVTFDCHGNETWYDVTIDLTSGITNSCYRRRIKSCAFRSLIDTACCAKIWINYFDHFPMSHSLDPQFWSSQKKAKIKSSLFKWLLEPKHVKKFRPRGAATCLRLQINQRTTARQNWTSDNTWRKTYFDPGTSLTPLPPH